MATMDSLPLLWIILALAAVNMLLAAADLYVDLRHARPLKRRAAIKQAAEHGVAYAEQITRASATGGRVVKGAEKFTHALSVARDELKSLGVKHTDAEVGRAIEVAISASKK